MGRWARSKTTNAFSMSWTAYGESAHECLFQADVSVVLSETCVCLVKRLGDTMSCRYTPIFKCGRGVLGLIV